MSSTLVRRHNETVVRELRKGDRVEFPRGGYSHWALYIGNEKVIHLAGDENDGVNGNINSGHFFSISGKRFDKARVQIDNIYKVAGETMINKNNSNDSKDSARDPEEIIEQAMSMLGDIAYNVLWSNCEHFVNYCRYGDWKSDQVNTTAKWTLFGALGVLGAGLLAAALGKSSDKKEEKPSYM